MPQAVAEAARVLERGGRLCASIPLFLHVRAVKP